MTNKYKNLVKDTAIFALGNMGSRLILFLLVPLYTTHLSTSEYGVAELMFTLSELIIPFLTLVIHDAVLRYGLTKDENKDNVIFNGIIIWCLSLVISLFIIPASTLMPTLYVWRWYFYLYLIARSLNAIEMNYLKVKDLNKFYALASILQTLTLALLNILLLVVIKTGIRGYILANVTAFVLVDIVVAVISKLPKAISNAHFDKELLIKMLRFSIPMIFTNISWWVVNSSDKLMVEWMIGASALGIYTVAAKIPSLINVFANIFSQAWGVSSVKEMETTNDTKFYGDILNVFSFSVFAVCIGLVSIVKVFMKIYVGADFYIAWKYIPLLLVGAVFAAITTYFGSLYAALKQTVHSMVTTVIGAIVNIVVNFSLIPFLGVWGAVIGTVTSYFLVTIMRMIDVNRYIKIEYNKRKFIVNAIIISVHSIIVSADAYIVPVSTIVVFVFTLNNIAEIKSSYNKIENIVKKRMIRT